VCEEAWESDLIVGNRLGVQPPVRASQADVMNGFDAASDHHGRGFAVDVAARTEGLPPMFQKRDPTHVVALKDQECRKSRLFDIHLIRYTRRGVIRRYDVTPLLREPIVRSTLVGICRDARM
jgi:hypothetical protein